MTASNKRPWDFQAQDSSSSTGGGKRQYLNPGYNDSSANANYGNKHHQNGNGNRGIFLFQHANHNPTQHHFDEFFRQQPELSSQDIIDIFLCAVRCKKKKGIDVLGGDKLAFVTGRLLSIASTLDGRQLTHTAMAAVNCLQAIMPTNVHMPGQHSVLSDQWSMILTLILPLNYFVS